MMEEREIRYEELTYPSADGKTTVHAYIWHPVGEVKGIIQLSHGMCEYVQRYDAWARRFAAAGYVFCGNDHLGHGYTAESPEALGNIPPHGDELLVEDVHALSLLIKARYPETPLILYGHSMGSFVARCYLSKYGTELSAALISGTAGPGLPTGLGCKLARLMGRVKGQEHRSKFLTSLGFGSYNKRFEQEQDALSWLTRDKTVRANYRKDTFCTFIFTTEGYATLFTLISRISKKSWAKTLPRDLPVLLFAGDQDPVGNYGKGVRAVCERMEKAGCNVSLRLYEGGRHEMHNELNADEVFADLIAYLKENVK
ncbi:MAG: alpha/beta fold hydrolase [Clostridia bacterium]|nr:alpha/beta fold hydrolase [Clostridia bacterium]